jgi:hypothetical protein
MFVHEQPSEGKRKLAGSAPIVGHAPISEIGLPDPAVRARPQPSKTTTYDYRDERGDLAYQVLRIEEPGKRKTFRQRQPDGNGGWIWNINGVPPLPYRLPEMQERPEGAPVFIVEGEKDADRLHGLRLCATCNSGGAGKWPEELSEYFLDADVVIIPDADEPGRKHAQRVAAALHPAALSVRVLPDLPQKDASDFLDAGGTVDDLIALAEEAPLWEPDPAEAEAAAEPLRSPAMVREEFPAPMDRAAYQGVIGEIVDAIEPETEADPAAVLVMMLTAAGACIGRTAHSCIAGSIHHCNLFSVIVGETAKARKSTAWGLVRQIIEAAEPGSKGNPGFKERIAGGVASGEALIAMVRDPCGEDDPGVSDKRLLVNEEEFARGLRVARRDGSIYPDVLRQAWDGQVLANRTKKFPMVATHPHISIVGTITRDELAKQFQDVDAANGLGNRFLWAAVRRTKYLPLGGRMIDVDGLSRRLSWALLKGQRNLPYRFDAEAEAEWIRIYPALSAGSPGLLGAVTGRAEAQVWRMAMLYAALDGSEGGIRIEHLRAALAVWDYCERSARWVFGKRLGDPVADDIIEALFEAGDRGMNRSEIRDLFNRNKSAAVINRALSGLFERGVVRCSSEKKVPGQPGRTPEVWRMVSRYDLNDLND